ncbi:MAG TPA: M56 family metallopeptidase, partial [Blastocatellia bacterium]|nr:M56 family metallopeptidase [Blastocatellia bacterium]
SAAAYSTTSSSGFPTRVADGVSRWTPSLISIVRLLWIAGAILLLAHLGSDLRRLYRIRRDGLPWTERRGLMQTLSAECGVGRSVEMLLHESILTPLTYGIWRPAIMLPSEAREWSEADLRRALVHELEHVRRNDWVIQLAARATCALYWFHPLVWISLRSLSLQAERACDDAVVRGAERTEYAEQLVLLARRLSRAHGHPALGMANRSDLSTRVSALLDGSQRRGRAGLLAAASALSIASLVVILIAPVRAVTLPAKPTVASDQAQDAQSNPVHKRIKSALDRALVDAAVDGDLAGIEELIKAGANVNALIEVGAAASPLIGAAREGRLDAVRLLLDRGADPNLAVPGDGNALIVAAREGLTDIVSLLLDRGAGIDQVVPGADNALIKASMNGHLDVVKLLVARGANVNAQVWAEMVELSGDVVLDLEPVTVKRKIDPAVDEAVAVKRLKDDIILQLMKDEDNGVQQRLLWKEPRKKAVAIFRGSSDVETLSVDRSKGEWRTPLGMAQREGHKDVVEFLLASGARE